MLPGRILKPVGEMLGVELPVQAELHLKVTFKDHLHILDREAPLLIWGDTQTLPWETEEMDALRADEETRWLTEPFPPGVHIRPEGIGESQTVMMLWDYNAALHAPSFPAACRRTLCGGGAARAFDHAAGAAQLPGACTASVH